MQVRKIQSKTSKELRKDVYDFLMNADYRAIISIKQVDNNCVYIQFIPKWR